MKLENIINFQNAKMDKKKISEVKHNYLALDLLKIIKK